MARTRTVPYNTRGEDYDIVIEEDASGVSVTPTLDGKTLGRWTYSASADTADSYRHYTGSHIVEELLRIAKADLDRGYNPELLAAEKGQPGV